MWLTELEHRPWRAFHLVYYGDRELLLREVVAPVLREGWQDGRIGRSFWIRYHLGGPHIRLRLQVAADPDDGLGQRLRERAAFFFEAVPSVVTESPEEVRLRNQTLQANDPQAGDVLYENHQVYEEEFLMEVERYGGPELLPYSLDFFGLSSLWALQELETHPDATFNRRVPALLRLFLRMALGFARGREQLVDLLSQPLIAWGEAAPVIVQRADEQVVSQGPALARLVQAEITRASDPRDWTLPTLAGRVLAQEVAKALPPVRRLVFTSQLHMAANRAGLSNAEEVYLARMLVRTVESLAPSEEELGRPFDSEPKESLRVLLAQATREWVAAAPSRLKPPTPA
jgi:Lantibiotic biosynthesis dehydratase C-term